MSHTIYADNGKSVTFTGACANEIIPSIHRSFVYKAKEGGYVRIMVLASYNSFVFDKFLYKICFIAVKKKIGKERSTGMPMIC
jgi:hypothetical protein